MKLFGGKKPARFMTGVIAMICASALLAADDKTGVQVEYTKDTCAGGTPFDFFIINNTSTSEVRLVRSTLSGGFNDRTPIKPYSSTGLQNSSTGWDGDLVFQVGNNSDDQFTIWCHTNKFCGNGGNGDYFTAFMKLYSNNRGWVKDGKLPNTSDVPALDSNRRMQIGNDRFIVSVEGYPVKPNGAHAAFVIVVSDASKNYAYGTDFREAVRSPLDLFVSAPEIAVGTVAKIWSSAGYSNHNYPVQYALKFQVRKTDGHIDFRSSRNWYENAEFIFNVSDYFNEGEEVLDTRVMVRSSKDSSITDTWGPGTVKFKIISFIDTSRLSVDYDPRGGEVDLDTEITVAADGARTRDNSPVNYIYVVRNNRNQPVYVSKSQNDPVFKFRPRNMAHIGYRGSIFKIAVVVQSQKNQTLRTGEIDSGQTWRVSGN